MADTPGAAPVTPSASLPPKPPSIGEKINFSIPAIAVAAVLSIGISYLILYLVNNGTREDLTKAMKESETKLSTKLGEVEKTVNSLDKQVEGLNKTTADLVKTLDTLNKDLDKFEKGQKVVDQAQNQSIATATENIATATEAIASTKDSINKVDTRVHYIEDKLKKLDEIAQDVLTLKGDTTELKKEYTVLKGDLTAVRNKADVTEKDLYELGERARMFQLRVLAARAREAADAARKSDLKTLISRLEDVEDK